jgi:hypothetical protein
MITKIPQPQSLWRYKYNHRAVYQVDSCDRYTVYYRFFSHDSKRQFKIDIDSWCQQYEELSADDVTAETGIF